MVKLLDGLKRTYHFYIRHKFKPRVYANVGLWARCCKLNSRNLLYVHDWEGTKQKLQEKGFKVTIKETPIPTPCCMYLVKSYFDGKKVTLDVRFRPYFEWFKMMGKEFDLVE